MVLYTTRGSDRLTLADGTATLNHDGVDFPVCESDVTCSAFKVSSLKVDLQALYGSTASGGRQLSTFESARRYLQAGAGCGSAPPPPPATFAGFDPMKDGLCFKLDKECEADASGDGKLVKNLKDLFDNDFDWGQHSAHKEAFLNNFVHVTQQSADRLASTVYFLDMLYARLLFKGLVNEALTDPLGELPPVPEDLQAAMEQGVEDAVACWANKEHYPCTRRELSDEKQAALKRQLTHANMPSVCSSAAIGSGNTGSGVAALGCFLWTIYDHYPFNNMAFQQSFDLFGFESITQATTNALASTEKASLTASIASAYMTNNFAASTSAALTWNTPMSSTFVSGRRQLQSPRELQSSASIARADWVAGHYVTMHQLHEGMLTDTASLDLYFTWACEFSGLASSCTSLTEPQVSTALSETCIYDASVQCTGPTCPANVAHANYPYCCTGSCSAGRQLTHGSRTRCATRRRRPHALRRLVAPHRCRSVGDSIRTPSGCEPITGLFHADAEATVYHRFTKGGASVAISDHHWLFVNGAEADPATVKLATSTTASGEQEAVVRVETAVEQGAFHILVASGAYYVDGVTASTYIAHVPLGVWKIFADGYASATTRAFRSFPGRATSRSRGRSLCMRSSVPAEVVGALWPITTAAAVITELGNLSRCTPWRFQPRSSQPPPRSRSASIEVARGIRKAPVRASDLSGVVACVCLVSARLWR